MDTLLIIDGNAIMHRAYHAIPPFKAKDGTLTQVTYGFLSMVHKTISDFHPTHVIVCFDTPELTFRQKLFKEYQAHRPKADAKFVSQIETVHQLLKSLRIPFFALPGYEADDIIGTLAHKYKSSFNILILTGDKDLFQLIDDRVNVISPKVGISTVVLYDKKEAEKKLGVAPKSIPDFKGLMGDTSDNYKGAKGIGPKTAAKLLNQFSTIEHLLTHAGEIDDERIRKLIIIHKKDVLMSKKLATIDTHVPIDCHIDDARFNGFSQDLRNFLEKYQMNSLAKRIFGGQNVNAKITKPHKNKTQDNQESLF